MGCLELTEMAPGISCGCATLNRFGEDLIKFQVKIASRGRTELKIAHAIGFNPQTLKINSDRGYAFVGKITRHPRQFLIFLRPHTKNTSGLYSSLKSRTWLKNDHNILHTRRYTELVTNLGSDACALFRLGTDVRYTFVSVGVKMHAYYTISEHG